MQKKVKPLAHDSIFAKKYIVDAAALGLMTAYMNCVIRHGTAYQIGSREKFL